MDVSALIIAAFQGAMGRYPEIRQSWIDVSFKIGSILPRSLLAFNVQKIGYLDLFLRSIEDEIGSRNPGSDGFDFLPTCHSMFSEVWIGSVYEIVRLLVEQNQESNDYLNSLAHDLRLIRITLEKHQIAADRKLTEPLRMRPYPPDKNGSDSYEYSKSDPKRTHIMPTGISYRGSAMWQVVDLHTEHPTARWIERREVSDRVIAIWKADELPRA